MGKSHSPTIFVVFEGFWRFLLLQRHSVLLGWRLHREIYEEAINSTRNKRDLLAKIMFVTSYFINVNTFYLFLNWFSTRVRFSTCHGNPRKSWNLSISFSRPGKSWKLIVGPWKSWKIKVLFDSLVTVDSKARTMKDIERSDWTARTACILVDISISYGISREKSI